MMVRGSPMRRFRWASLMACCALVLFACDDLVHLKHLRS